MELTCITSKGEKVYSPVRLSRVIEKLGDLTLDECPALVLESDQGYLQCRGSKEKMSIELHVYTGDRFKQFVLCHRKINANDTNVYIKSSVIGTFGVKISELFSVDEAKKIFDDYYKVQAVSENLNKRNITRQLR